VPDRLYHRLENERTQTVEDARLQEASGELWGHVPRYGYLDPVVQAYDGPLPQDARGIEFTTDVEPEPNSAPGRADWRGPRPGVVVEDDTAKIRIRVTKNTQTEADE
jgi:hypothetical protein